MTPTAQPRSKPSPDWLASARAGVAFGVGFLVIYLAAGFLFARWSLAAFLDHLTVEIGLWLFLAGLFLIAIVAVPVFLYRAYRLVSPVALLVVVLLGWIAVGLAIGAPFGLSLYVFGIAPVYLLLYALLGGAELHLRSRPDREQEPSNEEEAR